MSNYAYDISGIQAQSALQFASEEQFDVGKQLVYEIKGKPAFAYADISLMPGQRLLTDGNVMLWMDSGIDDPETVCWGGCMAGCCRWLSNEDVCMNTYTNSSQESRRIAIGENDPGDMLSFAVTPDNGWVLNDGAFIAGTDNLDIRARFIGCGGAMCSGEAPWMTKVVCNEGEKGGVFLAGGYGALVRHDIPPQAVLFVSPGLFFAAHEKTKIKMGLASQGLKTCCCTFVRFVMRFTGPTVVYTQSRDPKFWNPLLYGPVNRGAQ